MSMKTALSSRDPGSASSVHHLPVFQHAEVPGRLGGLTAGWPCHAGAGRWPWSPLSGVTAVWFIDTIRTGSHKEQAETLCLRGISLPGQSPDDLWHGYNPVHQNEM